MFTISNFFAGSVGVWDSGYPLYNHLINPASFKEALFSLHLPVIPVYLEYLQNFSLYDFVIFICNLYVTVICFSDCGVFIIKYMMTRTFYKPASILEIHFLNIWKQTLQKQRDWNCYKNKNMLRTLLDWKIQKQKKNKIK